MSKNNDVDHIPKKFEKLKEIVLKELKKKKDESFKAFPKDFDLSIKEKDEVVLLIIRTPLKKYIPRMVLGVLFLIIFPILIYLPISALEGSLTFLFGMIVTSIMLSSTFLLYSFVKWYYNVGIITDRRIIDIDFHTVLSHSMTETRLEKIVDITHKQKGIGANISDVGDVYIRTGGGNPEIVFKKISKPRIVQDFLNQLLEHKKKGEI